MLWPPEEYHTAYNKIVKDALSGGTTILILVAPTPDSVCTCMILKRLFKQNSVSFQVKPVGGYDDLLQAHAEIVEPNFDLRSVVLIGCGAMVDLQAVFPLRDEVTCYVFDYHRPVTLSNVYCDASYVIFSDVLLENEDIPSEYEGEEDDFNEEAEVLESGDARTRIYVDESEESGDDEDSDSESEAEMDDEVAGNAQASKVSAAVGENDQFRRMNTDANADVDSSAPSPGSAMSAVSSVGSKRKRGDGVSDEVHGKADKQLASRARRKAWEKKVEAYSSGTRTGTPSSYVAYDLVRQLGHGENSLLWYAIVGVTDHFCQGRIDADTYNGLNMGILDWVNALNPDGSQKRQTLAVSEGGSIPLADEGRIKPCEEFRFLLYRHWTVYQAMFHSRYISSQLSIWRKEGATKLDHFLAKIGISKKSCNNRYNFMSASDKSRLRNGVHQFKGEYDLDDITYRSFTRVLGYGSETSAADTAQAVLSMIECGSLMDEINSSNSASSDLADVVTQAVEARQEVLGNNFYQACNVLSALPADERTAARAFNKGIHLAKEVQKAVIRQGVTIIEEGLLMNAGKFQIAHLHNMSDGDLRYFRRPFLVAKLAQWLHDASAKKRPKPGLQTPIVICVFDESRQTYTCVGTKGRNEVKNRFGLAFRNAAVKIDARFKHDGFESSVIEIEKESVQNFTDQLFLTLESMDKRRASKRFRARH